MDRASSSEEADGSVRLSTFELRKLSEACRSNNDLFQPESSNTGERRDNNVEPIACVGGFKQAPEKKLTLFALRLAIFEKTATGLGTLGFIWATVVLLGGFAIKLDKTDFWFITIILLIEGTRIFSRSHELEWQHQATWSGTGSDFRAVRTGSPEGLIEAIKTVASRFSIARKRGQQEVAGGNGLQSGSFDCRTPTRTWISSDVPLLPYGRWMFMSRNVSKLLYWLQLLSALACVVLSSLRLIMHNYGEVDKEDNETRNRQSALDIFYALALAEAFLFLLEKTYWEYNVIFCKLLEHVNRDCELGASGMISIKRFFYDAYSKCVNGSIFDGLKMDVVSFGIELLGSSSLDEQLIGARILRQFSMSERFSEDTLQKIGVNLAVVERLVEMLNWKNPSEEEIRRSAAEILSKLAGKKQNSLRVAGIPGAMESISSLLQTNRNSNNAADEIGEKEPVFFDHTSNTFWTFNHLGLLILKKLARDHDNCGKIGNTRGLLVKIIDFTHAGESLLKDENVPQSQIQTVKRSLQVVNMLSSTIGTTGKLLRKEISEVVFTISNIRDILHYGEKQPMLQKLSIDIITSLGLEEEARERIGRTGGVLKELFNIFFNEGIPENQNKVRCASGDALAMLALESKSNCVKMLKLDVLQKLILGLEVPLLRVNSARILRNLCTHAGEECFYELRALTTAAPIVLKAIMSEENKLQEVMVGLGAQLFKLMNPEEASMMFDIADIKEVELGNTLICILKKYSTPSAKVPRIRRFAIELAIWMILEDAENIKMFKRLGLEEELEAVLETTAELESFNIFSGTVGLSRHSTTIHSLVETALMLLSEG